MFKIPGKKLLIICVTILLAIWLPLSVQAGLYKSVDENGNVVYSQTPPASGDYKAIKIPKEARKQQLSAEEMEAKRKKARESILGKESDKDTASSTAAGSNDSAKKEDKLLKDEAKKNKTERLNKCKQAREAKNKLEVYRRFKDKDGNVIRYSDEERAKMLKNANDAIKEFCG